jgi:acyl-CoA thioesterase FadM
MNPTTLKALLIDTDVRPTAEGLHGVARPTWIVEGEDRLSYTTLVRLVECCREHHWNTDILPCPGAQTLDSITKSLAAEFLHPVRVGSVFTIIYRIIEVRTRSYSLRFDIIAQPDVLCARFDVVCVFYDPAVGQPVAPPPAIRQHLRDRVGGSGK